MAPLTRGAQRVRVSAFRRLTPLGAACLAPLLAAACTPPSNSLQANSRQIDRIDDVIEWQGRIELQGGPNIANTLPTVFIDQFGQFVVADLRETQIRRYSSSGQLLANFGRSGPGPGEFQRLSAAVRQSNGDVLAFDMTGRLTVFDSNGVYKDDEPTEIAPTYDVARINDSLVAIAGRRSGSNDGALIHIWNNRTNRIERAFFPVPPHDPKLEAAYTMTGSAEVAARGDTLAAIFARADTVYLYRSNGAALGKIKIPFRRFRKMTTAPPAEATRQELLAWRQTFSSVSQIFWAADGSFYVQYYDLSNVEPQWRLLHMTRQGRLLFDIHDTPRLLAVAPDNRLFFLDPTSNEFNVWRIGKIISRG